LQGNGWGVAVPQVRMMIGEAVARQNAVGQRIGLIA
jgi:hypothetical protein